MDYEMEELVPIVGKLVRQYTAHESTSVTYEKAEQFMEAVLYCIHENEQSGCHALVSAERIPARQAYETGLPRVEDKVKKALELYHELLPEFVSFGNECLYDTVVKGLPEFFKWYDCRFAPQNTILTLDYPVIMDLSPYTGIDRIYEYILCIRIEQRFLKKYPQQFVMEIFEKYSKRYRTMIDNLCEIVLMNICGHILAEKKLDELHFEAEDYQILLEKVGTKSLSEMKIFLKNTVEKMVREYYENDENMIVYLCKAADNIAVRIKNAAENDALQRLF